MADTTATTTPTTPAPAAPANEAQVAEAIINGDLSVLNGLPRESLVVLMMNTMKQATEAGQQKQQLEQQLKNYKQKEESEKQTQLNSFDDLMNQLIDSVIKNADGTPIESDDAKKKATMMRDVYAKKRKNLESLDTDSVRGEMELTREIYAHGESWKRRALDADARLKEQQSALRTENIYNNLFKPQPPTQRFDNKTTTTPSTPAPAQAPAAPAKAPSMYSDEFVKSITQQLMFAKPDLTPSKIAQNRI
jgi:hypothetical protein